MSFLLSELADRFNLDLVGDPATVISGVSSLHTAGPGEISFYTGARYRTALESTQAAAVILSAADRVHYRGSCLISKNPYAAYAKIASLLHPLALPEAGIHDSAVVHNLAVVHPSASIAANAVIDAHAHIASGCQVGSGCYIGENVKLGADTILHSNVNVLHGSKIGCSCILHPGCVIGADGFGHAQEDGHWIFVPQLGNVVIGDNVSIGANTTIDRGALDDTVIGNGVKLDNLIHIAHNVTIGDDTAMAACVGVAGSTSIGRRCTFAGQVGIADNLEICDDAHFTGAAVVLQDINQPGVYSSGVLLDETANWRRNAMRFKQLDALFKQFREIKKKTA